jgi:hypothetical protein
MPFDSAERWPPRVADASWRGRLARAWRRAVGRGPAPPARAPLGPAVLHVLEEARGLIEAREDWTQGSYETFAGRRCAIGALGAAGALLDYEDAMRVARGLLADVARQRGYRDVEDMNDRSSHARVLAAFDAAIALAQPRAVTEGAQIADPEPAVAA